MGYANSRPLTRDEELWKKNYTEALAALPDKPETACQKFSTLGPAPAMGLDELVRIRIIQSCKSSEDPLAHVSKDWLKAESIKVGLVTVKQDYARIIRYIKTEESLSSGENLKLIYKEKKELAKKAFAWAKEKNDQAAVDAILKLEPTLYIDSNLEVPQDRFLEIANDLRTERRFLESRAYYKKIVELAQKAYNTATDPEGQMIELDRIYNARMEIRNVYKLENNKPQSVIETGKIRQYFLKLFEKTQKIEILKFYHDASVQYVRDVWTNDTTDHAESYLDQSLAFLSGKTQLGQLFWLKGRIAQERKQFVKASEFFRLALDETVDKQFEIDISWNYAWNEFKLGNYEHVISELILLMAESEKIANYSMYYRAQHWLARVYEKIGETGKAIDTYESVFEDNTFGYYGFLSFVRMIQMNKKKLGDLPFHLEPSDNLIHEKLKSGYWLSLIGEHEIASRYIMDFWLALKPSEKTLPMIESILNLCNLTGTYEPGQRIITELDNSTRKKIFTTGARWYFSTPYFEEVKKQSERFGIDYEYTYGIMRQESLFNEKARSAADAFGLLQLLPRVAEVEAPIIGVNYKRPEDLYKPEVNIPLGAHFLAKQRKVFKGSLLLSAASYNAGEGPVKNWLETRYNGNSLEFIEDIPYAETQNYARLIFRNYSLYMLLNGDYSEQTKLEKMHNYFQIDL